MQHKYDSFLEASTNVLIGYIISLWAYAWIINPLFNLHTNHVQSFGIVSIFTVISLVRQYVLGRLFNGKSPYAWFKIKLNK